MRIVVHIDRLILDGVAPAELPRLQAALERELTAALLQGPPLGRDAAGGAPANHAPIDVSRGPERVGEAIARAAHARIAAAHAAPATKAPTSPEARP